MKTQIQQWKSLLKGKTLAAVLMLALTAGFGGYEFLKPAPANAASVAHAAAALDDNSVSAISALDHAMETLAAHVTPAVVNVTVTSRAKQQQISGRTRTKSSGSLDHLALDRRVHRDARDRAWSMDLAAASLFRLTDIL